MFKWKQFNKNKPKRSGLYFVRLHNRIEIAFYDQTIENFLFFEEGYKSMYVLRLFDDYEWSAMPRFSRSKLLYEGIIVFKEEKSDE